LNCSQNQGHLANKFRTLSSRRQSSFGGWFALRVRVKALSEEAGGEVVHPGYHACTAEPSLIMAPVLQKRNQVYIVRKCCGITHLQLGLITKRITKGGGPGRNACDCVGSSLRMVVHIVCTVPVPVACAGHFYNPLFFMMALPSQAAFFIRLPQKLLGL